MIRKRKINYLLSLFEVKVTKKILEAQLINLSSISAHSLLRECLDFMRLYNSSINQPQIQEAGQNMLSELVEKRSVNEENRTSRVIRYLLQKGDMLSRDIIKNSLWWNKRTGHSRTGASEGG